MVNINLLPPEIKAKLKKSKQAANVFSICLVVFIVIVTVTLLLTSYKNLLLKTQLDNEKNQLDSANKEMVNFNDLQDKALFLNDRGKLAAQIENIRPNWSQILESLINAVPTDVQLASLTADAAKSPNFTLKANTTSDREAIKFKDKLASIPFFKDVAFKSSTTTEIQSPTDASSSAANISFTLEFNLAQFSSKQGNK